MAFQPLNHFFMKRDKLNINYYINLKHINIMVIVYVQCSYLFNDIIAFWSLISPFAIETERLLEHIN